MSKKMEYLKAHVDGRVLDEYEDRNIVEVTVNRSGDVSVYRLEETSDGEWIICEK